MNSENLGPVKSLGSVAIGVLAVMGILYFAAFYFGKQGYGYTGY